ncbi:ADP-ribose pyrophosphatase [Paenibacillus shirakamiensis]|uniref:ADP-ribose pyrophosphatase n=1 Tax=Paenibacillus shirakamiensis TaxID=1265935 RepID=A0ABS4JCM2_9BACL|nr:NUDIX hydrolase [Paenibacillus shirakamiensis]MBP1999475.1 ADP-ribose pyrophosphatase [Paenibacillus shirakamiensis]
MTKSPNPQLDETTISSEQIFKGKVISLQVDTVELPNGTQGKREIIRHPGAVAVLAVREGKLLLVNQYRQAMGRCELEIPAGKLEVGEDPMEAAQRELKEETGYDCSKIRLLHSFYTSPGFADEIIHLYLAEDLIEGASSPDEDEFVEVHEADLAEVKKYVADGWIADAKTLLAVYMWELAMNTGQFGHA